ncbi:MAG: M23 family metallopeptidase [Bacillota bacterium]|nr:M23 family metallopeptidase [Bacillota bacterium]
MKKLIDWNQLKKLLSDSGEKSKKQMQSLGKQLLEKLSTIGDFVRKKGAVLGNKWYYFAILIIVSILAVPMVSRFYPTAVPVQGGQLVIDDDYVYHQMSELPKDLFSEQQLNNKSVTEAAKLAPIQELEPEKVTLAADENEAGNGTDNKNDGDADDEKEAEKEDSAKKEPPKMTLAWPVTGDIVKAYGFGYSKAYDDYRFNSGMNIKAAVDKKVTAAAAGKVVAVSENLLYNTYVLIEHDSDVTTLYGNLKEANVAEGDRVEAGAVIGSVGKPGYHSLGVDNSLFFQIQWLEESLDPAKYLEN